MNKYRAKKVTADGYTFDSQAEYKRYCELKLLEKAGQISHFSVHPRFELVVCGQVIGRYTPDFYYVDEVLKKETVEDVKGVMTRDASIRIRVFQALFGLPVTIIGKKPRKVRSFKRAA